MRFATWNVNSVKARLPRLLEWLAETRPDVLCLQETKVPQGDFPSAEVSELGYQTAEYGQGRWNGVALLSRVGLEDVRNGFAGEPGYPDPEARAISALCDGIRFMSVYVPNGRTPDDPHYTYKLSWLSALRTALQDDVAAGPVVVAGDFNVAPTDADVWDTTACHGGTHVSAPERAAFGKLVDWGLVDTYRAQCDQPDRFTWWDYRAGMFHKNYGMRIDHLLATRPVAGRVRWAEIDREARKGKPIPSDHAPLLVDVDEPGVAIDAGWSGAQARIAARRR
jgi:exodeoxyribonuclease-3